MISVVTAVYNMESYLEEAIESIVNQTLGIDKIQLILVNDGSKDTSLDICRKYEKKYPDSVIVIDKENGGVSSARNLGLKKATGKFINFMDADDKLKEDACEKVLQFFERHDVDVVSLPLIYFDAKEGNHILNWKFSETRVVDIDREYEAVQMHISSSFIRREVVQKFRFLTKLKYGEDAELINKCILQKRKYGVISDTAYMYRFRASDDSAMQKSKKSYDNYFPVIRFLYWSLIKYEKQLSGKGHISKYLENLILYDLKWKLRRKEVDEEVFGEEGKGKFLEEVSELLQEIDDRSIMYLNRYPIIHKIFMLSIKYKIPIEEMEKQYKIISGEEDQFVVWKNFILSTVKSVKVFIEIIEIKNDTILLEGKIGGAIPKEKIGLSIITDCQGERREYPVIEKDDWRSDTFALNEDIKRRFYFKTPELAIKDDMKISCILHLGGVDTVMKIGGSNLAKLSNKYKKMYLLESGYLVSKELDALRVQKYTPELAAKYENEFIEEIKTRENLKRNELSSIKKVRKEYLDCLKSKKHIKTWVFMDRPNKADDNAEHLFRYAVQQNDGIRKYFVVSEDSVDYKRMKQYGTVLKYGSKEHQLAMMEADVIISSHANNHTYSPFPDKMTKYFTGFLTAKRVFLQHGITKDDLSEWLHKLNKDLKIFVTASPYEYESIVKGKYGYDNGEIILSGFPRYDNLKDFSENYILYLPTWDSSVLKLEDGMPVYSPEFKHSRLYKEINDFLNDKKLNEVLKKSGYKILFKPHPNMMKQIEDFEFSDNIVLAPDSWSYQKLFGKGKLLITDYSSTFFDFAYLKKPVIYYHVRSNHLASGYFDYDTMGMGKVVHNEADLIQQIEKYINNGFKLEEEYLRRTKKFFKYLDRNNCKRVYDVMLERF